MIENAPVRASSKDHPEGDVDLEVARMSENLMTFDGLGAMETISRGTSDGADQQGGAEV
jgi:hypothetical protein